MSFKIGFGQPCGNSSKNTVWGNELNWKAALAKEDKFMFKWNDLRSTMKPGTPNTVRAASVILPQQTKKFATTLGRNRAPDHRPHPQGRKYIDKCSDPSRMGIQCVWEPNVGLGASTLSYEDQLRMHQRAVSEIKLQSAAGYCQKEDTRHTHGFPWHKRSAQEPWCLDAAAKKKRSMQSIGVKTDLAQYLEEHDFFRHTASFTRDDNRAVSDIAKRVQRRLRQITNDPLPPLSAQQLEEICDESHNKSVPKLKL